ncbi:tautomerase family protein [Pseudomonas sp. CF161]|uniref:tautomerase family protein n=1 Tax=Pseudomonas sp. CF161 TaxID=911241 RepID=UPI0003552B7B|nr:tautomerase family protein [Pseudomonas sp. CF161]EPL15540.1 putative tautomerase [Pseudomonas sp. CF161]
MPNILIKVPTGAFNQTQRQQLLRSVSDVAMINEHMGSAPQQRALCWALVEEVQAAEWLCGGMDPHARFVPCMVTVKVPAGVLDAPMRQRYVRELHAAIQASLMADDQRQLLSSIQIQDVVDGTWGANGDIWYLADFTRAAGYGHL